MTFPFYVLNSRGERPLFLFPSSGFCSARLPLDEDFNEDHSWMRSDKTSSSESWSVSRVRSARKVESALYRGGIYQAS